jgi:hydrogenase maturation protease
MYHFNGWGVIKILAKDKMNNVLILGIGNILLSDEGVGVHLVKRMQRKIGDIPGITYLDGGTLSFTLAEPIAQADGLIVVDAARMGHPPGTLKLFFDQEMDRYLKANRCSVHEVSLSDLLDIACLTQTLPQHRCLLGIEPETVNWGDSPSRTLIPAIEQGICKIMTILSQWRIKV